MNINDLIAKSKSFEERKFYGPISDDAISAASDEMGLPFPGQYTTENKGPPLINDGSVFGGGPLYSAGHDFDWRIFAHPSRVCNLIMHCGFGNDAQNERFT